VSVQKFHQWDAKMIPSPMLRGWWLHWSNSPILPASPWPWLPPCWSSKTVSKSPEQPRGERNWPYLTEGHPAKYTSISSSSDPRCWHP
jgi:hypothetical protein